MKEKVWITWEIQQRNRSMSDVLGADLYELISDRPRFLKYPILSIKTLYLLYKHRNRVVFLQNPSIVLCVIGIFFKKLFKIFLVVDEHNAGLFPLEGKSRFLNWVARLVVKESSLVIVTNENLKRTCEEWGGNAYVMPDPIPRFGNSVGKLTQYWNDSEHLRFLFICSWAEDEPYQELLLAAKKFSTDKVRFIVSGNYKNKVDPHDWPSIDFIGFIPRENYLRELELCDAVIVLTTRKDCLNCGAYEAIAAGKPGLLSDSSSLRRHFNKGFIFTNNTSEDIYLKINSLIENYESLYSSLSVLKEELDKKTVMQADELCRMIT